MSVAIIVLLAFCTTLSFANDDARKFVIGPFFYRTGLGVCLTAILNHIVWCEATGRIPVVYWDHYSAYQSDSGFNGAQGNVWDYYFEPVSHLKYQTGDHIAYSFPDDWWTFNYLKISPTNRRNAHRIIKQYIKYKPVVQEKIDTFYNTSMAGKRTIGIHLRGTDKAAEEAPIAPETMIKEALRYADENTQFLLATDEQRLLDKMIELLEGRTVVYYDCYRSVNGAALHRGDLPSTATRAKPSHAQLGEDVIVEMALLGKCDYLIHTLSNVSSIALYFNPEMPHVTMIGTRAIRTDDEDFTE